MLGQFCTLMQYIAINICFIFEKCTLYFPTTKGVKKCMDLVGLITSTKGKSHWNTSKEFTHNLNRDCKVFFIAIMIYNMYIDKQVGTGAQGVYTPICHKCFLVK